MRRSRYRVVELDGNPWFVAKDVCEALGYARAYNPARMLDDDEKGTHILSTRGGPQRVLTVSEPGLYKLIQSSRKPEAKDFDRWVRHVVLPTIRKEGAYVAGEENIGKGTEEDDEAIILRDTVRMLDDRVSLNTVSKTLVELGYYRSPSVSVYRVRRGPKTEGRFVEKHDPVRSFCTIFATADGKEELARLVKTSLQQLNALDSELPSLSVSHLRGSWLEVVVAR